MIFNFEKIVVFLIGTLSSICTLYSQTPTIKKINGVNLVSPSDFVSQKAMATVKQINSNWVSVIPYAFTKGHHPKIHFNTNFQWWGEKFEGTQQLIKHAKSEGLKIMLKPHIWIKGDGWAGDYTLSSESDWKLFETEYTNYILAYAEIAQQHNVELFCIATEFRQVVKERPEFWCTLIQKIRTIYKGKLTYAANWDNYQNVLFWSELDYIGLDIYFPLSEKKTPTVKELMNSWKPIIKDIKSLSDLYKKPIVFTEYGYKSANYTAAGHWKSDGKEVFNSEAQINAYTALYKSFWNKEWIAGGFLWKWYLTPTQNTNTRYTPQKKPVLATIKKYYKDQ